MLSVASGQPYTLRNYKAMDGLPQSQVLAMAEDNRGYLWLGTYGGGLARFDGRKFFVYTTLDGLLSNTVLSLFIDRQDNLWVVHPHGMSRFDGKKFHHINFPKETSKNVMRLFEVGDTLYFQVGNQGSVGKIHRDSVLSFDEPVLPHRSIYYGLRFGHDAMCYYLNDSSFLLVQKDGRRQRAPFRTQFQTVKWMVNYGRDALLSTNRGLFRFDYRSNSFSSLPGDMNGRAILYDTAVKAWWYVRDQHLLRKDANGAEHTVLSDVQITQILVDREGITWLATAGNGLYKYYQQEFERKTPDQIGAVTAIGKDRSGAIWIGAKTLQRIHQGKTQSYFDHQHAIDNVMEIKTDKRGILWVASFSGLGRYDSTRNSFTWYTRQDGLYSQYISSLDFDDRGVVWCGSSDGGLNSFDGKTFKNYSEQGRTGGRGVYSLRYFPRYKTLFACYESWIKSVKTETGELGRIDLPELTNSPVISTSIYQDSLLLLGSLGSGLMILNPQTHHRTMISTREGLTSNLIYFVAPDADGFVWIGTEQGISKVRFNRRFELVEQQNFSYENGLVGVETNQNAYYLGAEKFFGLVDGLYQYVPRQYYHDQSFPLHFTGVEVLYGDVSARTYSDSVEGPFKVPSHLRLPFDKNHITFSFSRVDKSSPNSVRYQYRLRNYDKSWSQPTDRGMVTYSNLPPGEYEFQVLATNYLGSWDPVPPLRYSFVITAPFYRTTTFSILVITFVTGLVLLILFYSVRARMRKTMEIERIRQQEQAHLRKEIARDFHDEMGNQLTRIINYISLMRLSENGKASEFHTKVENAAKYLYTGTRDFIWSIDPVNDELSKLFFHIRDFGEKLFEEKGIEFRAYNELKLNVQLPYGFSREANLIMKEAMTNAFNHSQAKNVSFTLAREADGYSMELKDDGRGFDRQAATHNGLNNMAARARRIQSDLQIKSEPGGGTSVKLIIQEFKTHAS